MGKTFSDAVQEWREQIAVNLKPSTVLAAESHFSLKRLGNLHPSFLASVHLRGLRKQLDPGLSSKVASAKVYRKHVELAIHRKPW